VQRMLCNTLARLGIGPGKVEPTHPSQGESP
jgi:hypothetical protein